MFQYCQIQLIQLSNSTPFSNTCISLLCPYVVNINEGGTNWNRGIIMHPFHKTVMTRFWTLWTHYRGVFLLLFEQMGMQKHICGTLPFTALEVYLDIISACWSNPIMMIWQIFTNNIYYYRAHLIFIRLLLVADGHVTGMEVHIDVVVTGNAPAALLYSCNTLELQVGIATMVPLLSRRRKAINPPIHINSPQEGAWHDAPCCKWKYTDICR